MELENCPYCHHQDDPWIIVGVKVGRKVWCSHCGAQGPDNDPDGSKWNDVAVRRGNWSMVLNELLEARRVARKQYAARLKAERERDEAHQFLLELNNWLGDNPDFDLRFQPVWYSRMRAIMEASNDPPHP